MQFHLDDMTCGGCVRSVTAAIAALDHTATIEADTVARTVKIETLASEDEVKKTLADAGFPVTPQ